MSVGKRAYEYFRAFERGLDDVEIAQTFNVSIETVGKYRHLTKYYDLSGLTEIVIKLRRDRSHLSTIYKSIRRDPRFMPYDDLFLLAAICRRIWEDGREISRLELRAALKRLVKPEELEETNRLLAVP